MRIRLLAALGSTLAVILPGVARAQAIDRPADQRPELEDFEAEAPAQPLELPPAPAAPPERDRIASGLTVRVRAIRVVGSTVFSEEELQEATRPWVDSEIDSADLQEIAGAVTSLYESRGYLGSGAQLPDQDLAEGVLVLRAVEARLVGIDVEGNRWYRDGYYRARIRRGAGAPVRVEDLESQIQILLQSPDIERIEARLQPGAAAGELSLAMQVIERAPFDARLRGANDNPPGIGPARGRFYGATRSLLGLGDELAGWVDVSGPGLNAQYLTYELPVGPWGTSLFGRFRRTDSRIVEQPFAGANITADTWTLSAGLRQELLRTPRSRLDLGVLWARRQSTTFADGVPESFTQGPQNGRSDVSVVRVIGDYSWRSPSDAVALRSTLSVGLDILGATINPGGLPDGRFVAWLGQAQWAHRLPGELLNAQVIARFDAQLANDALLPLEQIALGGVRTVRGYRENLFVRDNAIIGSVELRIPVLPERLGRHRIELATFVDAGHAYNNQTPLLPNATPDDPPRAITRDAETIASVGVGLRYGFGDWLQAYFYWGGALRRDLPMRGSNIQDDGVHLGLALRPLAWLRERAQR